MLDGNVLLRQKRDEVPEGTLSCPDRNLAVFHHYRHYEGLRLLPSVYDSKLIQQTLIIVFFRLPCPPLAKRGALTHSQALALSKRARDVTALLGAQNRYAIRLAEHQSPRHGCAGWDRFAITYYNFYSDNS